MRSLVIFLVIFSVTFWSIHSSPLDSSDCSSDEENPSKNGLLPPDAGEHGQRLALACEILIDEFPHVLLNYFQSFEKITEILKSSPKIMKTILDSPNVLKQYILNPDPAILLQATIKFKQDLSEIFQILAANSKFKITNNTNSPGSIYTGQLTSLTSLTQLWSQDIGGHFDKMINFFEKNPNWGKLFSSEFAQEFVIHFLPEKNTLGLEERQKILKLMIKDTRKGLELRSTLVKENKSNLLRQNEENFKKILEKHRFVDQKKNLKALEEANGDYQKAIGILIQQKELEESDDD